MSSDPTPPEPPHITAILLAAGRSERMGAFKPLLPFGNSTVIASCIDYLNSAGVTDVVVVVGHRAIEIQQELRNRRVTFAVNPDTSSEMNASIEIGIQNITSSTGCVLIALVDHPAVDPESVKALLAEWELGSSLVIPTWEDRGGHPVLIDLKFRQELLTLDPDLGLKAFFRNHRDQVARLPVSSPYVARDIDTWDDYVALHVSVFGKPPSLP